MDTLYRKGHYQEIIQRLNSLQKGDSSPSFNKNALLQGEVNKIIEGLRNRGDQLNARIHYILLVAPLLIVLAWDSIANGFYLSNVFIVIMLLIALGCAHFRMKHVITLSQQNSLKHRDIGGNSAVFILTKMDYLNKAIDIKKSRLLLVSLFYIVFFPIFLVKLHEVAIAMTPFDSSNVAFWVAYLVGGALWYFYYNRAFEVYDDIEVSLDLIKGNLDLDL